MDNIMNIFPFWSDLNPADQELMKNALQRFGKFLSAMVMPNIGAFIAWGFITALFIPDGWIPNEMV